MAGAAPSAVGWKALAGGGPVSPPAPRCPPAGTEVAWNQVKVSELVNCKDSKEERDRLFAEIRVLKQLKHRNIMTFYDSWLDPKNMSINFITELFTSGTLRQCVRSSAAAAAGRPQLV